MVGEEVFEGRPLIHRHALPGEGVILLHRTASCLKCAAKVVARERRRLRLPIPIVGCSQCSCANAIPIVREVPFRSIVPRRGAITTGKALDKRKQRPQAPLILSWLV